MIINAALTSDRGEKFLGDEFNNIIYGNNGDDTIDGGPGADKMFGSSGSDTYIVDNVRDSIFEFIDDGFDGVVASVSYLLYSSIETLTLSGVKAIDATGTEYANRLVGNAGNNTLDGRGGDDVMTGRGGDDIYGVDSVNDQVIEAAGGGNDTIFARTSYTIAAGQEIETLRLLGSTGTADLDLTGNAFGQTLVANRGDNTLDGRGGADVLTGGRGADTFVFSTALGNGNVDRITDFSGPDDTIRLSKAIVSELATGPLSASTFKDIAKAGRDADDHILYDSRNGKLFYDVDGSGKAAAVQIAVLDNKAAITHADVLIV